MLRDFALADFITLGNGFAGMGSVLATAKHLESGEHSFLWLAIALLPLAALLDFLDGRVARWRQRSSPLGAQLDSLADLVSFGVAPALLGFAVGLRGGWDGVGLVFFVACGLSRLARYNVTAAAMADASGKVKYFEGLPIPTSLVLVLAVALLVWRGATLAALPLGVWQFGPYQLHPLTLVYVAWGGGMISKTLRVPKP